MKENVKVGHVLGKVAPTDSINTVAGQNMNAIRYTLTSATARNPYDTNHIEYPDDGINAFEIDKSSGNLVVSRQLDREKQSEYRLEVRALDTSATNNPQSSAVTIRVEVVDVNDNSPKWPMNPIILNVPEDIPVSTVISNYSASDADTSANADLRYSLVKAYPEGASKIFLVDTLTGIITLNSPLDYEEFSEYTLIVRATDQAVNVTERRSTSVAFVVKVSDSNDNEPVFISPVNNVIVVNDVTVPNSVIAKVIAVDKDSNENGRVSYVITNGNEDGRFTLGYETGYLMLSKSFVENGNFHKGSYVLNISASDHGSPAKKSVLSLQILVGASKETPPKFVKPTYTVSISEDVPVGSVITKLEARAANSESGKFSWLFL